MVWRLVWCLLYGLAMVFDKDTLESSDVFSYNYISLSQAKRDSRLLHDCNSHRGVGGYRRYYYLTLRSCLDCHSRESGNPEAFRLDTRLRGCDGA
jgi:hypothetical protein